MKLGCICGCFNRAFDAGTLDQPGFLERCATMLKVQGVELQDIHFPQTRAAYLQVLRRTAADLGLASSGSASTTTSAAPPPPGVKARSPR